MLGEDFGLGSPMNISLLLGQKEPLLNETAQNKCIIESLYKSDKRQKSTTKEGKFSIVKKLIKELKDDSLSEDSYTYLYKEIVKAEANNNIANYKTQSKVDKEVKNQLPKEVNDTTFKSYSALTISKLSWESLQLVDLRLVDLGLEGTGLDSAGLDGIRLDSAGSGGVGLLE
ncbi:24849_t:CDS:2, partial [Gigaspora margarita]